jgi:hypothetical protein
MGRFERAFVLWSLVYLVVYGFVFTVVAVRQDERFDSLIPFHILGMVQNFAAFLLTIRDLYRRDFSNPNSKLTWLLMMFFTGGIGWFVYLYLHGLRPRPSLAEMKAGAAGSISPIAEPTMESNFVRQSPASMGMSIQRAFAIPGVTALVLGIVGAAVGYLLAESVPDYYRTVFRIPDDSSVNLHQLGIALGLTQGFVVGLLLGAVVVLAIAWSNGQAMQLNRS